MSTTSRHVATAAVATLVVVGALAAWASPTAGGRSGPGAPGFAPLPTSTTTTTTIPAIIAIPPTSTRPTIPPVLVTPTWPDDETTPPSPPATTVDATAALPPPPSTVAPAPPPVPAAAPPAAAVLGGVPAAVTMVATVAARSGDEIVLGELSGDPADWSAEVLDYLASENIDPANHSGSVGHEVPGVLVSNEGCAVQCITSGVAYAVGTGAHLRVTTSTPASIRITIFGESQATSPAPAIQWGHTWPHLHHNLTYTALVRAEDAAGNVAFASGSFHTLNRYARIDLDSIGIDPHPPFEHPHLLWSIDGAEQSQAEGGLFILPLALWAPGTPVASAVELQFQALLHDHQSPCSPFDSGCTSGYYGEVLAATFDLDAYPDDAVSWTRHELAAVLMPPCIPPTLCDEPTPLAYSAAVRVSVWYDT